MVRTPTRFTSPVGCAPSSLRLAVTETARHSWDGDWMEASEGGEPPESAADLPDPRDVIIMPRVADYFEAQPDNASLQAEFNRMASAGQLVFSTLAAGRWSGWWRNDAGLVVISAETGVSRLNGNLAILLSTQLGFDKGDRYAECSSPEWLEKRCENLYVIVTHYGGEVFNILDMANALWVFHDLPHDQMPVRCLRTSLVPAAYVADPHLHTHEIRSRSLGFVSLELCYMIDLWPWTPRVQLVRSIADVMCSVQEILAGTSDFHLNGLL